MAVTIKGIMLGDITISNEKEGIKVKGDYSIMSMSDVVLAKQCFNGYNDIKVNLSAETMNALTKFREGLKKDVEALLGFTE
jgi:hypothetical protein